MGGVPWGSYQIVVSDLLRRRPIWFGGEDRAEKIMALFYGWLGEQKAMGIRLAVMDMWKPFRTVTNECAPQASILFDKFHNMSHLGKVLDEVRKAECRRLSGQRRSDIKGQKNTLLSHRENLTPTGRQNLKKRLAANKCLNTAYLLKESFGQLWDSEREGWARRFFGNGRASLEWQRLEPYKKFAAMIDRHWDGIAAYSTVFQPAERFDPIAQAATSDASGRRSQAPAPNPLRCGPKSSPRGIPEGAQVIQSTA